jgi:hypothetical protein
VTIKVISSWPRQLKLEDNGEMRRFDRSGYEGHIPELVAERDALRAIVDALPRCEELETDCKRIATETFYGSYRCDDHPFHNGTQLPYAEALRAYEAGK